MMFGVPIGKIEFSKPKENKKDNFYRVEDFDERLKTAQENKEMSTDEKEQEYFDR